MHLHAPPVSEGATPTISSLHPDILSSHILTRLEGSALAAATCASSEFNTLADDRRLWSDVIHSAWPSISSPRVRELVSSFPPRGPRSFFSAAFPLLCSDEPHRDDHSRPHHHHHLAELISAVDVHYRGELIFSKVLETETASSWFKCSPFRIDLIDQKDVVTVTSVRHPDGDENCAELVNDVVLSWILIDPIGNRAVNMSSFNPVSVQRHWLTGEAMVQYATILAVRSGEHVQCGILVTFGASEGGKMQVREVSMRVEDMDGTNLAGKDVLEILERCFEGRRRRRKEEEGRRRFEKFLEMKRERKERKLRNEGRLDILCVSLGVALSAAFFSFVFCT